MTDTVDIQTHEQEDSHTESKVELENVHHSNSNIRLVEVSKLSESFSSTFNTYAIISLFLCSISAALFAYSSHRRKEHSYHPVLVAIPAAIFAPFYLLQASVKASFFMQ